LSSPAGCSPAASNGAWTSASYAIALPNRAADRQGKEQEKPYFLMSMYEKISKSKNWTSKIGSHSPE